MKLLHYTLEPFAFDPAKTYEPHRWNSKPTGLWLSCEGEEEDMHGWKQWCESEDTFLAGLKHCTEVALSPTANILWLANAKELVSFTKKYELKPSHYQYDSIDWQRLKGEYQGIIIAPYIWECRLMGATSWYYTWDCSSACIWDMSIVSVVSQKETQCLVTA